MFTNTLFTVPIYGPVQTVTMTGTATDPGLQNDVKDGKLLVGAGDNRIKLWNVETGQLIKPFRGHKAKADRDENLQLWEREWFDFAVEQVPLASDGSDETATDRFGKLRIGGYRQRRHYLFN